jgi:uncharacterized repeat protein (TIGR03803 family)
MANPKHYRGWISDIRLRAAGVALTLAVVLVLVIFAIPPVQAQTFADLYNYKGLSDGGYPYSSLVRDSEGNLYGTTYYYGSSDNGVVFKIDTKGKETVLYTFTGASDGRFPFAGLVRDEAENLYGTTEEGGAFGSGVVFKLDKTGKETVLHSFVGGTTDGCQPYGALLRDSAGNLFGTTWKCGSFGYGVVFKVDTKGKETVLHSFAGGSTDGAYPYLTSLLMDAKGNLYGDTYQGGTANNGTVYELSNKGKMTVLHSFAGGKTDGCAPTGSLVRDSTGHLYGTAETCGASTAGIVWKVSMKGAETILHTFTGGADGGLPYSGVIVDAKGNLYGDTDAGASLYGTVYKLDKQGKLTVLHTFTGSDGEEARGGLMRDSDGTLYGTTVVGGTDGYGTVWKLTP